MPKFSIFAKHNGAKPHKTAGRFNTSFLGSANYAKMATNAAAKIPKMAPKGPAFQIT